MEVFDLLLYEGLSVEIVLLKIPLNYFQNIALHCYLLGFHYLSMIT